MLVFQVVCHHVELLLGDIENLGVLGDLKLSKLA
jgi:hypothetical protein